jgi:hypothetical protein
MGDATASNESIFQVKYVEFANNLRDVFPESSVEIDAAVALTAQERVDGFKTYVLPIAGDFKRESSVNPGIVLPSVVLTDEQWASISDNSKKSIQEYLTLLGFTFMMDTNSPFGDESKAAFGGFMDSLKEKMSGIDFKSITEKFASMFGGDAEGIKLPEKFLKGHLARLAEEMMREFKPEDFGLDVEELKKYENDPTKAFDMLLKVYTTNPGVIQGSIQKIGKRLQAKIQSGSIKPQEIAAEAEELMKEFSTNPAFVQMMGSFKSMFGMEDPDLARAAGRESNARLALVRERMRKTLEARKAAAAAAAANAVAAASASASASASATASAAATAPAAPAQSKGGKSKRK